MSKNNEGFKAETKKQKEGFKAETKKQKEGFKEGAEKCLVSVSRETETDKLILDTLSFLGLDPINRLKDTDKAETICNAIIEFSRRCKKIHVWNSIIYHLKYIGLASFNDLINRTKTDRKTMDFILKEYLERGIIEAKDNLDDEVDLYNNVRKHFGLVQKRKVYKLSNNRNYNAAVEAIDEKIPTEFKQKTQELVDDWTKKTNKYFLYLEEKAKEKLDKTKKPKGQLDKIRDALTAYIGKELTLKQITYILHHSTGIISKHGFRGKADKYGNYPAWTWEEFLSDQGLIEIKSYKKGEKILICERMNRFFFG